MSRIFLLVLAGAAVAAAVVAWWNRDEDAPSREPAAPVAAQPAEPPPAGKPELPVAPTAEDTVFVRFEDGTELTIRVGFVFPLPSPVSTRLPAHEQHATLRRLAEAGDAVAARALHELLSRCMATSCEGVTPAQASEALDWLERAARGGDYVAAQRWADHLGDSQEGFEAWEALWRDGDVQALGRLARHYERGVPASTGGQPDLVRAHAYRLVEAQVREAVYSQYQGLDAARARLSDRLRASGGLVNPQQDAEAQALAKEILAGNPNCCRGSW
ncbi:MAG TPA: hypothetical protein VH856_01960 [Steroidobacteraceae bacterium]